RIIQARDKKVPCPNCFGRRRGSEMMRYRRVSGKMARWSPGVYAWFCVHCPAIILDGSIISHDRTWDFGMKEREIERVEEYLSAIIRDGDVNFGDDENVIDNLHRTTDQIDKKEKHR